MALAADEKQTIVKENQTHDNDSGSCEVQVALLTERINRLTDHMRSHRHDYHSQRGLLAAVSKRNRLLRYLQSSDRPRYLALIQKLGLRK